MDNDRTQPLVENFEHMSGAFADTVRSCPESAWTNARTLEGWSVAALSHHVAKGHGRASEWIATMTAGQPVTLTEDDLDRENAADAERFATCSKAEVIALHERNRALARALLRALSTEDLDKRAAFGPAGGAQFPVERVAGALTRHMAGHLENLRAAIEAGGVRQSPAG